MMRLIQKGLVLFILLAIPGIFIAQNLSVKARAISDTIQVRFAPADYDTWRAGIETGYQLLIKKLDADGNLISITNSDIIYPTPENQWGDLSSNESLGLAHALMYDMDQAIYEGVQGAYTQEEDRINRYGFAMFAADMSLEAAGHMGLLYTDIDIELGYQYQYQIFVPGGSAFSNMAIVNTNVPDPLPAPDSLSVYFGDEEFTLLWYKVNLESYYTSYVVEYSTDGGNTFQAMNENPLINLETAAEEEGLNNDFMIYRDSIDNHIEEYQFRVKGKSLFGEEGPYSEVVSGKGQPRPFPLIPLITEVLEMEDSSFKIDWSLNEDYADSISHINIWRYLNYPDDPIIINPIPLDKTARTFSDYTAGDVNHYRLEVIDINDNPVFSPIALAQRIDSIPPAPPQGLVGVVDTILDSISIIRLSWLPNAEEDFKGYHVYKGNSAEEEAFILTSSGAIGDTVYLDTIYNFAIGEYAFYKLKAVDFNGNHSSFSDTISVARPDLIPPVPPVFKGTPTRSRNSDAVLSWINSPSKDVVSYELQRKPVDSESPAEWETIMTRDAGQEMRGEYLAEEIASTYWYRVVATDDAGLQSASDSIKIKEDITQRAIMPTVGFNVQAKVIKDKVVIKYSGFDWETISNVVIYKSTNDGPIRSLARIEKADLDPVNENGQVLFYYEDSYCKEGNSYQYFIQACYPSGNYTNTSEGLLVEF